MEPLHLGALASLGAAFVWSVASLIFERYAARYAALVVNVIKCSFALLLLYVSMVIFEGHWLPSGMTPRMLLWLGASGIVGLTLGDTAWFAALRRIGARRGLLIFSLVPPMTAALGFAFLGDPFTRRNVVGMCLTLLGVGLVIFEQQSGESEGKDTIDARTLWTGVGFALLACLGQAGGAVLTKAGAAEGASALDVSVVRLAVAVVALWVQLLFSSQGIRALLQPWKSRQVGDKRVIEGNYVLLGTFFGAYIGIWLMNAGFLLSPVGVASTLNSTSPIFVLPLAAIFLGEKVGVRSVLGACLALGGVALFFL